MSPICCCFGKRSAGRRSGRAHQAYRHDGGKGKQDGLQSPLSCNSYISEYYDAQENFSATEAAGPSPPGSTNGTPRVSICYDKHQEQAAMVDTAAVLDAGVRVQCDSGTGGVAAAVAAVSIAVDGDERFEDGRLAGTSETSEEPLQGGGGGAISKLASCLSILDGIRIPGTTPTAAAAAAAAHGPFGSAAQPVSSGGGADGGGGSGRPTARRLGGKLEPGCTLRRRDMSASVLDVREAWDECADDSSAGADPDAAPCSSGRPFLVRGVDYMRTKTKVPSCGPLYRLLAADVISSDTKLTHVARIANIQHLLRPAVDPQLPPLLIITIMLPTYPVSACASTCGCGAARLPRRCLRSPAARRPVCAPVVGKHKHRLAQLSLALRSRVQSRCHMVSDPAAAPGVGTAIGGSGHVHDAAVGGLPSRHP
ncbi:hypothetical protein PLESTM_000512000 [Pleodorina starrii]|nr:hypothetical protein PLESTM_000512000 [Pleodorina starrii]